MNGELQPPVSRRQMIDRYEVLAEIASGGMATVYLGRLGGGGGFERLVAIKRLHPHLEREKEFIEMFLDEARIAARIHHPNVVPTLEFGASERGHFLVMDYIEGATLAKLLAKAASANTQIPPGVGLRIVLDALAGLAIAHELTGEDGQPLNVVHRDVSPQNVLVGVDGSARITDFGVARAASRLAVTRTGQLKGKLGYMAPEQARGDETDRRADVFAMGIIMWEVLAGRRLFRGRSDSEAETLSRVLYGEIPRVRTVAPDVPEALDEVLASALERDLSKRFPSCHEFIDAVEQSGIRIGTPREVARYVEEVFGPELTARRDMIRRLAPVNSTSQLPALVGEGPVSGEMPKLLSSVSSAAMSVAEPSMPTVQSQVVIPAPPPPPRSQAVLIGALSGSLIVAAAAVGLLYMSMKQQAATPAVQVVTVSAPPLPPASATADHSAAAAPSSAPAASAAPSASVAKPIASAPIKPWGTNAGALPGGPIPAVAKPKGPDGLDSKNPYRH